MVSMVRTQISLTERQIEGLRDVAAERGVSMAALLREAVERLLADRDHESRMKRLRAAAGRYQSGLPDVGVNHDKYLEEAYDDW